MKVILDLSEDVLEKLEAQAKVWGRSRKSHLQVILTEHSESYDAPKMPYTTQDEPKKYLEADSTPKPEKEPKTDNKQGGAGLSYLEKMRNKKLGIN